MNEKQILPEVQEPVLDNSTLIAQESSHAEPSKVFNTSYNIEENTNEDKNKEDKNKEDKNKKDNNDNSDNVEHPSKRIKVENENISSIKPIHEKEVSESVSPVPQVLTTTESKISFETTTDIPTNLTSTTTNKHSDVNSKSSIPSKDDLVKQSGRHVEEIIDGSDLRKFLNKSLTKDIVKALDEIVELWEAGEFNNSDAKILRKNVIAKFTDILKKNAEF
ncbi:hypothetical protein C6P40_005406 [Pichia californica]|uniref:Uncharacterized protein n=1 Tax=Pichia californica TaxID=460514 RepID=A0A9P7BGV1_9ASCO|nr:hypothetical protein C6P42_001030 [[Candida] californica]KAG0689209.1 hypothetical protein C6P40_005406 [[Candida] californica]